MHLDARHLGHAQHRVVVEVRLLDHPVLERNRPAERRRQAEAYAGLHLHRDDVRVDGDAAVDRAHHAIDMHGVLAARHLDDLGDERIEGFMHRNAARAPRIRRTRK